MIVRILSVIVMLVAAQLANAEVVNQCSADLSTSPSQDYSVSDYLCQLLSPVRPLQKCDSDDDCPGFANSCFAGECTGEENQCDSDADCPGFANSCFAGKCTGEPNQCDSDDDCPGFANSCFAGKCTNP